MFLAVFLMAALAAFTAWLSWASRRNGAFDRLIDIASMAGQLAPFSGRETMGGWSPKCSEGAKPAA
jgi:hypothetical protein